MGSNFNYKRLFSIQSELEKIVKKACPTMTHTSGIYFYTRVDDEGKYAYIGKSVDVIDRSVSHIQGYKQPIDISLKKRGFYSEENKMGWHLNFLPFPENLLDERESFYIDKYRNAGYTLYNVESGGTVGKEIIGEKKAPKGYKDGLAQGRKNTQKEVSKLFEKNLIFSINGTPNKNKQKSYDKFDSFLKEGKDNNDNSSDS